MHKQRKAPSHTELDGYPVVLDNIKADDPIPSLMFRDTYGARVSMRTDEMTMELTVHCHDNVHHRVEMDDEVMLGMLQRLAAYLGYSIRKTRPGR